MMFRSTFLLPIGGLAGLSAAGAILAYHSQGSQRELLVAVLGGCSVAFAIAALIYEIGVVRHARSFAESLADAARAGRTIAGSPALVEPYNLMIRQLSDERAQHVQGHEDQHDELEVLRGELKREQEKKQHEEGDFHQKTRSQILEAHSEVKLIIASIPSILVGVSKDGRVTHWNAAAEFAFGIPSARVLGKPFSDSGIAWDWDQILGYHTDGAKEGRFVRLDDVRFARPDGKSGFLSISLVWLAENATSASSLLLFMVDITDRKSLELHSVQSMKLEAIGQLASGIAHEINTPTQYVGDNIRFMDEGFCALSTVLVAHQKLMDAVRSGAPAPLVAEIERLTDSLDLAYILEEFPKALLQSSDGIERISTIVQAMKEFSHPDPGTRKLININRSIENTINVARNEYKYVAEVVTAFDDDLPAVSCCPGELNQVFLNVLINAAHAITAAGGDGKKGRISITTRRDGEMVEIAIADTGIGIPDEAKPRVFDPFFTTKEVGKGTGQGLYIAREIVVRKHRGTIEFETEMGCGTTFRIRLPIAAAPIVTGDNSAAFRILTSQPVQ